MKPTVTTSYVLTLNVCGALTKDTIMVDVWKLGIPGVYNETPSYHLAPNPAASSVTITRLTRAKSPVGITMLDLTGRKVYAASASFANGTAKVPLEKLPSGIYYIRLHDEQSGLSVLKLIKE